MAVSDGFAAVLSRILGGCEQISAIAD